MTVRVYKYTHTTALYYFGTGFHMYKNTESRILAHQNLDIIL